MLYNKHYRQAPNSWCGGREWHLETRGRKKYIDTLTSIYSYSEKFSGRNKQENQQQKKSDKWKPPLDRLDKEGQPKKVTCELSPEGYERLPHKEFGGGGSRQREQ